MLIPQRPLSFTRRAVISRHRKRGLDRTKFSRYYRRACNLPSEMSAALGVTATYVGINSSITLSEVASEKIVREMKPDFGILRSLECRGGNGNSKVGNSGIDFISRFFAPGAGIDEDPEPVPPIAALLPTGARN